MTDQKYFNESRDPKLSPWWREWIPLTGGQTRLMKGYVGLSEDQIRPHLDHFVSIANPGSNRVYIGSQSDRSRSVIESGK